MFCLFFHTFIKFIFPYRYVAKSGAVIDANIVNFSLPKKTAKVEKMMQKKAAAAKDTTFTKELKKLGHEVSDDKSGSSKVKGGVVFPKSSRRETKVPLKYRMDGDFSSDGKSFNAPTPKPPAKSSKKTVAAVVEEEELVKVDEDSSPQSKFRNDDDVMVAVKSRPPPAMSSPAAKSSSELTSLGVGTFSIDIETAKGMLS